MPRFTHFDASGVGIDFTKGDQFLYGGTDTGYAQSDVTFTYATFEGGRVRVVGVNFTYDASDTPTSGTMTSLYFDFDNDGVEDAELTGLAVDVTNLMKGYDTFIDVVFTASSVLAGTSFSDVLQAGDAGVYFIPRTGNDTVLGGDGNDSLTVLGGSDYVDLGAGNDVFYIGSGALAQAETLIGGTGVDALSLRSSDLFGVEFDLTTQTLVGAPAGTVISGFENLWATDGNDTVHGSDDANHIIGWAGDDLIFAAGGDDTVSPGEGHDTVDGGSGYDVINVNADWDLIDWTSTDGVTWTATLDYGTVESSATFTDFEEVWFITSDTVGTFGRNGFGAQLVIRDNGIRVTRVSVDDGALWNWVTRVETYDDITGERNGIVTTFDNGDVQSVEVDPTTQQFLSARYEDLSERTPWAFYNDTYTNGLLSNRLMVEDDGDTIYSDFTASGVRTLAQWRDVSDSVAYDMLTDNFDASTGQRTQRRYEMDGGDQVRFLHGWRHHPAEAHGWRRQRSMVGLHE